MEILGLILNAFNNVGSGISIISGIYQAINKYHKITAEDLFKKSFVREVKQNATTFADQTDPKTVDVDENLLDNVIASLKDEDEVQFAKLDESEKIAKITTLFRNCIIVPNHLLSNMDFERRIRPIIEKVIIHFYSQLPFNQEAFNQIALEYIQNNIVNQDDAQTMLTELSNKIDYVRNEVTQRLSEDIQAIKDDTETIKDDNKELRQTTQATYDLVSKVKTQVDLNTSSKLKLDMDWFQRQFNKQLAEVREKFDASLHIETKVDAEIHALLGDKTFVLQITKWIEELEEKLQDLKEEIDEIRHLNLNEIEWDEEEKSKIIAASESLHDVLVNIIDKFKLNRKFLDKQELTAAQSIDWAAVFGQLCEVFDDYEIVKKESGISQIKYIGENEYKEQTLRKASSVIHGPRSIVARLWDKFFPSVIWKLGLINKSDFHILGDAGIGKTHIACNICDDRLKNGLPALFVRGNLFTADQPIDVQLLKILDIPPVYSWHDFLQALSATAEAYHTRIPLIIDGLNESIHNVTSSNIWESELKVFVQEITQAKNLILITTCRRSYKDTIWKDVNRKEFNWEKLIWKDNDSPNLVYAYGFDNDEVTKEAISKYFNAYKINADITLAPLAQFEHPLYLKIFCETKNRVRMSEVKVYIGEQTLFKVFDEYLEICNKSVCEHRKLRHGTSILQPIIDKIAEYLWKHNRRYIPLKELVNLTDNQSLETLNWLSSIACAIEAEGLLVCRDYFEETDVMSFTYDLLGGYLIAKYLVEHAADDPQGFLNSKETVNVLFSEDHQTLHPLHEDICRCLAAILPAQTGNFLHQFSNNENAFGYSICALFEISVDDINDECINLVKILFTKPENRKLFFELAETTVGHPNHPFNARFWTERLLALSMSERDLSWTEYVRKKRYDFEDILKHFEENCRGEQELSDFSRERLHLLAEHIMWILTSTVRPLRDKATRALYWYGRQFPKEFFELVIQSFTINDPYVFERMLAATYGIAMAHHNSFEDSNFLDEELHVYGRELYENMFKPNAPHATTHILARDYAKRTIDIALIHKPDLLTDDEKLRIKPPYTDGGIREWGECENKNEGEYKKGPDPIQMDFKDYTLRGLIKSDNKNPNEHKSILSNVYWRIYELEFTNESFADIDGLIAQSNSHYGRSGDGRKTDRYGKKYSWIAYFELSGFRQDQGKLPDYYDNGRCIEADIDPSFPDENRKYNLVTENFLGEHDASTEQWVLNTPPPDLTHFLNVDQLCEEQGSWVLLDGHLGQEDKPASRKMSAWMQGIIVRSEDVDEILDVLNRQELIDGNTVPFIPEDNKTYAGEIPWCDSYPPNDWREFSFLVRKYTIPKKQFELLRGGEPISFIDDYQLWDTAWQLIEKNDEKELKAFQCERNLEIKIKTVDEEKLEHKDFEVLVPVRYNCWEEAKSGANLRRSIALPNREITDCLNLYKTHQSFDLYEKDSKKRASISFEYGDIWSNPQSFTYLRKDLLDRFLSEIDGKLIWVIWGNRLLVTENHDGTYKTFQDVRTYRDLQNPSGDS